MKKILSLLLAAILAVALVLPAAAVTPSFPDVPANSTLKTEIEAAANYGLMNGMTDGTFGYANSMTRSQFVTVLDRMFGWSAKSAATPSFSDVPMSNYWYPYVETAVAHQVVDAGGTFRPYAAITREEMAVMLVRALGYRSISAAAASDSLPFKDVSGTNRGYISMAYAIGMTKGTTATTFAPKATATRAQAAAMLVRIYEKYIHSVDWLHGFYSISSYSQISLTNQMDAVSAGWSRMCYDSSTGALLSTTTKNSNEFYVPSGYSSVTDYLSGNGTPLNLCVYMDTSVTSGSTNSLYAMLASEEGRGEAVQQIINELTVSYKAIGKNPYAGVTIDFEGLRGSAVKANYNTFLTELAAQVHALGKNLYVTVQPVLTTGAYFDGYDYRTIGTLADKVLLMAHDYNASDLTGYLGTTYYKTTALTPISQVYESLRAITDPNSGVQDTGKIALAINCTGLAWETDANGLLTSVSPVQPTISTIYTRLKQTGTTIGWSDTYLNSYATYTTEDGTHIFLWYEDSRSVAAKVELAKLFGIDGVSLWRLGNIPNYDDSGIYYNVMGAIS